MITAQTKKIEFHIENLPSINSSRSLMAHYEAVSHLLDEVIKFHKDHANDPEDAETLETYHALAHANLEQLLGIDINHL